MIELERPPAPGKGVIVVPGTANLHLTDREMARFISRQQRAIERSFGAAQRRHLLPPIGGGAVGNWTFVNTSKTNLLNGTFDLDSDSFKIALLTSASNIGAGSTLYSGLTGEVANANGYLTGGIAVTLTLAGTTTVTVDISVDPVWTAAGGSIVARYAVLYEVSGNIVCYSLLDTAPADVTATDGNTLTVAAASTGVSTLA